jgi:enoyl-CoA hydratase/carnithine racemase
MNDIVTELSESVLRVELNRPAKKNAMTAAMYTQVAEILQEADQDPNVRAVLWHGAGDSFCAGNDVADFLSHPPSGPDSPQARLTQSLLHFGKPLVAAVQGRAVGGGTTMLTHCDVVLAGESALFQISFVDLALAPEFGSSFSLPARSGYLAAAEMILLGERISAARAAEFGLVTKVVPDAALLAEAQSVAAKLAAKPAESLRGAKRLLRQGALSGLTAAIKAEGEEFAARVTSPDAKEAFAAFLEKRQPRFAGVGPTASAPANASATR